MTGPNDGGELNLTPAMRAERMTDAQIERVLVRAGLSLPSAAAATDVFRQVCQAVETGRISPRAGRAQR